MELPETIRRQIGTEVNRRHLMRLPAFSLPRETPRELTGLLAELEAAEQNVNRRGKTEEGQSGHHWPASAHGHTPK